MNLDDATVAAIRTLSSAALRVSGQLTATLSCYSNLSHEAEVALSIVERPPEVEADLLAHAVAAREAARELVEQLARLSTVASAAYAAGVAACQTIETAQNQKELPDG